MKKWLKISFKSLLFLLSLISVIPNLGAAAQTKTIAAEKKAALEKMAAQSQHQWTSKHARIEQLLNADTLDANAINQIMALAKDLDINAKNPQGKTILVLAQELDNNPYYDNPDLKPSREFEVEWNEMMELFSIQAQKVAAKEKNIMQIPQANPMSSGFEELKKDQFGRILGWLTIPDFKDAVFVRVTPHKTGYSLEFMVPENYGALTSQKNLSNGEGLYFWKSVAQVKETPKSETFYWGDDSCFEPSSESAIWHPAKSWTVTVSADTHTKKFELINPYNSWDSSKIKKIYHKIPSLEKNFGGSYRIFLYTFIPPIKIDITKIIEHFKKGHPTAEFWAVQYKETNQGDIDIILKQLPASFVKIIHEWINDKLKNSGLSADEINKISNQFIYEIVMRKLRYSHIIDIRDFLTIIDNLSYCSSKERKEMIQALQARPDIYGQMTAEGKISCNPGLRQQD